MEFKVNDYQLPEVISCNYEELKAELTEKIKHYETLVYTDEQIKDAKTDRANLNKLATAIDNERKRIKAEYMKPYEAFEMQVKDLTAIVKKPVLIIDTQIKEFEAQQKESKKNDITAHFDAIKLNYENAQFVALSQIFKDSWLNASVSMKSIKDEIEQIFENATSNIATLETLPDFSFEAVEIYKQTLDMGRAIQEAKRMSDMQKAKEEAARKKAEFEATQAAKLAEQMAQKVEVTPEVAPFVEERSWISFKAYLTVSEAKDLKAYFDAHGIKFGAV